MSEENSTINSMSEDYFEYIDYSVAPKNNAVSEIEIENFNRINSKIQLNSQKEFYSNVSTNNISSAEIAYERLHPKEVKMYIVIYDDYIELSNYSQTKLPIRLLMSIESIVDSNVLVNKEDTLILWRDEENNNFLAAIRIGHRYSSSVKYYKIARWSLNAKLKTTEELAKLARTTLLERTRQAIAKKMSKLEASSKCLETLVDQELNCEYVDYGL